MHWLDPMYFLWLSPAILLGIWAQFRVRATVANAQKQPAPLSGAAAARHILDSAGLQDVAIEEIPGQLSDHYDPRATCCDLAPIIIVAEISRPWGSRPTNRAMRCSTRQQYALMGIRNAAIPASAVWRAGFR